MVYAVHVCLLACERDPPDLPPLAIPEQMDRDVDAPQLVYEDLLWIRVQGAIAPLDPNSLVLAGHREILLFDVCLFFVETVLKLISEPTSFLQILI
jgi:hypothetical protein